MTKKQQPEFDNHINNLEELIQQLESLKQDARSNMPQDEVFVKDYHALRITINYLREVLKYKED